MLKKSKSISKKEMLLTLSKIATIHKNEINLSVKRDSIVFKEYESFINIAVGMGYIVTPSMF